MQSQKLWCYGAENSQGDAVLKRRGALAGGTRSKLSCELKRVPWLVEKVPQHDKGWLLPTLVRQRQSLSRPDRGRLCLLPHHVYYQLSASAEFPEH